LDLGIGTGESSRLFQDYGCKITGLDGSEKMLKQCQRKNIGHSLVLHNLEITPFPFKNYTFNLVLSNGVFHLTHPIQPIFCEVKRLLQPKGFFAFTFENEDRISNSHEIEPGIWQSISESGVYTYKHSGNLISELLKKNNFTVLNSQKFLAFTNPQLQSNTYFTAVLAQR
jgi:SAM-dependent methyltransferase